MSQTKQITLKSVNPDIEKYGLPQITSVNISDDFKGHAIGSFIAMTNTNTGEILEKTDNLSDTTIVNQILTDSNLKLFKQHTTAMPKDKNSGKQTLTPVDIIYMPYVITDHTSLLPTVTNHAISIDNFDITYNITIEILFVHPEDAAYKYYAVFEEQTNNMSMWDIVTDILEDPTETQYHVLFLDTSEHVDKYTMRFYDDSGHYIDDTVSEPDDLKNFINSVRITNIIPVKE